MHKPLVVREVLCLYPKARALDLGFAFPSVRALLLPIKMGGQEIISESLSRITIPRMIINIDIKEVIHVIVLYLISIFAPENPMVLQPTKNRSIKKNVWIWQAEVFADRTWAGFGLVPY